MSPFPPTSQSLEGDTIAVFDCLIEACCEQTLSIQTVTWLTAQQRDADCLRQRIIADQLDPDDTLEWLKSLTLHTESTTRKLTIASVFTSDPEPVRIQYLVEHGRLIAAVTRSWS